MNDFPHAVMIGAPDIERWRGMPVPTVLSKINAYLAFSIQRFGGTQIPGAVVFASNWTDIAASEIVTSSGPTTLEQMLSVANPYTAATGRPLRIFVERKVESPVKSELRRKGRELFESLKLDGDGIK